jgi:glycosyltransferase involved in cell wall biosynthesis
VIFKCHYHKWRLDWTFPGLGFKTPTNVMIVPHGVRPDRRYGVHEVPQIRRDLHLDQVPGLSMHLVGLITTGYSNKRWDILTNIWEEIRREILARTGQEWDLLAAGAVDDTRHEADYKHYKDKVQQLEHKGLAHHYEFVPGEESYYKMMAVCDFIVLPSTDETQAGTLARIIALNKPFITSAPIEGLTAQTLESGGGLLFTNEHMLREAVLRLASDEGLRLRLGNQLKAYLDEVVSWDIVAGQYNQAYDHARNAKLCGASVDLPREF